MYQRTKVQRAVLAAIGSGLLAPLTWAQAQDAPQRIEITGSSIRRTDAETPSPVQVITAAELKASGYTSTQDVLHNLTANGQGTLSQGFSGAFAEGASGIALRGLTVGATLILIDGKRMAPYPIGDDGQRSFVDISNIPFDAIEKIEVLKDGASATYGSDAIAGVINVILKKKYAGATVNLDLGASGHSDGQTYALSGIWGFGDLATDGRNFYISGEVRKQNQIKYSQRGMSSRDFTSVGGNDLSLGAISDFAPNPQSTTGYVKNPVADDTNKYFLPGCNQADLAAKKCTFLDTWSYLQPPTENYNLVSRYTQSLGSDWQLVLSGSFFERKLKSYGAPVRTLTGGFQGITSGPGVVPALLPVVPRTTIPSTNPAFPQSAKDAGITRGNLYYTFLNDLGPTLTDIDSKTGRLATELSGRLGNWDVGASLGYSEVKLRLVDTGQIDARNLQSALDNGTFVPGTGISDAVRAFISPTLNRNDKSSLWYVDLTAGTDLATLQGGALSVALGAHFHEQKQHATSAAQVEAGLTNAVSNSYTIGKQQVSAVYTEVVAPITKALELDGAVRYDRYNISGGKASPKVGFKFKPVGEVLLRGTASKGFRAPGPAENGTAGQTFFAGATNDPVLCADGNPATPGNFPSQCSVNVGTIQSTTPSLKPETSSAFTLGVIFEPTKNLSLSIDFFQIKLKDQIVTDTSSDPTIVRGTNFTPLPQTQASGPPIDVVPSVAPIAYQTAGYINANSTKVAGVDIGVQYKFRIEGIGEYKTDFLWSYMPKYDITIDGVTYKLAGTHGPFVISGDTGNPKSRIQWSNSLSQGGWSVTGTINYISSFNLTDPSFGYNTCYDALDGNLASTIFSVEYSDGKVPAATSCKVASFTTFDLYARYQLAKNFSVHGSVTNLFDRKFPKDWNTYGGQTYAPYNPSMHSAGAIGRYFNIGASYTF